MVTVQESNTEDELLVLKRMKMGKRVVELDLDEAPPMTCPRVAEPSDNYRVMVLTPTLFRTDVPMIASPLQPGENEESIMHNPGYLLTVANSIVPISNCQYMMSGGMEPMMNDLSITAI